jgi:mannosyltransferase OCH1-like enzyme
MKYRVFFVARAIYLLCILINSFSNSYCKKAELIIYSFDRPMQLYALLESLETYVTGIGKTTVIYRTSEVKFEHAYKEINAQFQNINMIKQKAPQEDFKPLTLHALNQTSNEFIIFAVDDIIVTDYIDVSRGIEAMEKYNAYGFYYKMGKNLSRCYTLNCPQPLPPLTQLDSEIFRWEFGQGYADWAYPHTLDMTLYRKKDIQENFVKMDYYSPNRLEACWADLTKKIMHRIGLCFEHSKVVNIPLNIVQKYCKNKHMNYLDVHRLLTMFDVGKKIDIYDLYKVNNQAVHMEYIPIFIERTHNNGLVDFDFSMGKDTFYFGKYYRTCLASGNDFKLCTQGKHATELLDFFRSLYNKNYRRHSRTRNDRIPKVIHMVWLGKKFPEKFHKFRQSWINHHPDWTHILWVDNPENYKFGELVKDIADLENKLLAGQCAGKKIVIDVKHIKLYNQRYYDKSVNFGEKSDLFRYEALYKYGGLYVDVDFECLKPFNDLNSQYDFYCGIQPLDVNALALNIALMGTIAQHPILKDCIETIKDDMYLSKVFVRTGPVHFTKSFWRKADDDTLLNIAFPATYFYPLGICQPRNMKNIIKNESYAVHWWAGSWT